MTGFGLKLKTARELKGLTQSQLASSTKIMVQIIQGLEEENFSRIVAPIYGRGFVKLYAQQVGLDPQECTEEFMIAYSASKGEKINTPKENIKESQQKNAEPPPADIFTPKKDVETDELSKFFGAVPKVENKTNSPLSRQAMPFQMQFSKLKSISIPKRIWRLSALAVLTIGFIWLVVISIKGLYKATSVNSNRDETAAETLNTETVRKAQALNAQRTPIKNTPELYFD